MNLKMLTRSAAAFSSAALLASAVIVNMPSAKTKAEIDSYHDDWLHVNENAEIVDMYGNPVWLTGCNWFGYNVTTQVFDGVWSRNMHEMLNEMADHGFNIMRVPMSTQILLQWMNEEPDPYMVKVNEWKNPELTVEGIEGGKVKYSFDIWNQAVAWCRENGIKIMIDIHCATTASNGHQYPVWYDSNYSYDDWLTALNWVADYYKDDDTIIAIDLKNEPHGKPGEDQVFAKWDSSTDENNWKYAAERGAQAVLSANPNLLIMVEGIESYPKFEEGADWNSAYLDYAKPPYPYSNYYGAWWGGNFRGARDYPVNLGKYQSQLVYSPHDYGPLVWKQTWFNKNFTRETLLDDYWYTNWAYLVEENISPLFMGEWGGFIDETHDPTGDNTKWMTILRDYMIEKRIHHTFWCFNENSGDTGGLLINDFQNWDEDKYALVKPALWQDENGKFISLDHEIKLGQAGNGISLSDYYSGGNIEPRTTATTNPYVDYPTTVNFSTTESGSSDIVYGDANLDNKVTVADCVAILQHCAARDKYELKGQALINSDVDGNEGVTAKDALTIQMYDAKVISQLPVKAE